MYNKKRNEKNFQLSLGWNLVLTFSNSALHSYKHISKTIIYIIQKHLMHIFTKVIDPNHLNLKLINKICVKIRLI